jgi:hypothetical protein
MGHPSWQYVLADWLSLGPGLPCHFHLAMVISMSQIWVSARVLEWKVRARETMRHVMVHIPHELGRQ